MTPDQEARELLADDEALTMLSRASNIRLDNTDAGWFVIDTNSAEPDVNWPGECVAGPVGYEEAKRAWHEAQATVVHHTISAALRTRPMPEGVREALCRLIEERAPHFDEETGIPLGNEVEVLADAILGLPALPVEEVGAKVIRSSDIATIRDIAAKHIPNWPLSDDEDMRADVERALLEALATPSQSVEREALIRCGRAVGCILSDRVSDEFLRLVPAEVEAKIEQLQSREREALERAAEAVREKLFPKNDKSDWTPYAEIRFEACTQAEAAIRALIPALPEQEEQG